MINGQVRRIWFSPVLAPVLHNRLETLLIVGFGVSQTVLAYAHLQGWPCPIKAATGIPCPGCGLSTAVGELLHGHLRVSLQEHAFAPLFLGALVLMTVVLILPAGARAKTIDWIGKIEKKTGATAWFLTGLMIYWGLRITRLI